ncbi:SDR family NAD(P)-dependent oxidoreductase [Croceicoccus mobilis]|uniref:3-beta hydroxysteroid dehydrogenase n=1 Tax=Croceicoccus mobilis TaxID=1703339 RepID=A0A916YQW3_9SPHN|nr:SDR family oxidoreductase [Croceicoccus mobilis]GGD57487.1 hypothetical protein GCM10010990_03410 [Croceicoccus mobilis]
MAARLAGKTTLVTGSAQGIGQAIAAHFESEGAEVWRGDLQPMDGERALHLDVSNEESWAKAIAEIKAGSGKLDILVNNAGIEWEKPLQDIPLGDWRKVMSVNVDGIFLGCRTAKPLMERRVEGRASVINISSVAGIVGFPDQVAYNTSKGAVRHLTKSLAVEWAAHGTPIRCNSIHPGCINTPMLAAAGEKWVAAGLIEGDSLMEAMGAMCPLNEVGDPSDIAWGAVYLASDEAKFVTGLELVIDGGFIAR